MDDRIAELIVLRLTNIESHLAAIAAALNRLVQTQRETKQNTVK